MDDELTVHGAEDESPDETGAHEAGQSGESPAQVDLDRVRDLVLAAHTDVVPEMVQGTTFDELMTSIEPAREAYQRIAGQAGVQPRTPKVAAQPGQRGTTMVDVESLSPLGKISEGLKRA